MKRKTLIKIVLIIIISMLLCTGNVKAVYQSTPYTYQNPKTQTWDAWLTSVRTTETTGGAMGLTETLDGVNATSESNNIDVHMAKGTEYGAAAILSASGYGNLNNTNKPETSTADTAAENKTGVYYNYNEWEFTACIAAQEVGSSFSRYWDKYNTLGLRGMSPSSSWHGGSPGIGFNSAGLYDRIYFNSSYGYYINRSAAERGKVATRLSVGKNGIFTYNWDAKGDGYERGGVISRPGNGTDGHYYAGTYYSAHSFYARGAAINMTGV